MASILDLPLDIYDVIFSYLSSFDLFLDISGVCKLFQTLITGGHLFCTRNPRFCPHPSLRNCPTFTKGRGGYGGELTDHTVKKLSRAAPNLETLYVSNITYPSSDTAAHNLHITDRQSFGDPALTVLLKALDPDVCTSVILENVALDTVTPLAEGLADKTNLKTLILRNCAFRHGDPTTVESHVSCLRFPCLEHLEFVMLNFASLESHQETIPSIEPLFALLDPEPFSSSESEGHLESVIIGGKCGEHAKPILAATRCLHIVKTEKPMDFMPELSPRLEELRMKRTKGGFPKLSTMPRIKLLEIAECDPCLSQQLVAEHLPVLSLLDLKISFSTAGSSFLAKIAARFPNLRRFVLFGAPRLSADSVCDFVRTLGTTLVELRLPLCPNVCTPQLFQGLLALSGDTALESIDVWGRRCELDVLDEIPKLTQLNLNMHGCSRELRDRLRSDCPKVTCVSCKTLQFPDHPCAPSSPFSMTTCDCGAEMSKREYVEQHRFDCELARRSKFTRDYPRECFICRAKIVTSEWESHLSLHLPFTPPLSEENPQASWTCPLCFVTGIAVHGTVEPYAALANHLRHCKKNVIRCHQCMVDQKRTFDEAELVQFADTRHKIARKEYTWAAPGIDPHRTDVTVVKCVFPSCGFQITCAPGEIPNGPMLDHLEVCPFNIILCRNCELEFPLRERAAHMEACPGRENLVEAFPRWNREEVFMKLTLPDVDASERIVPYQQQRYRKPETQSGQKEPKTLDILASGVRHSHLE